MRHVGGRLRRRGPLRLTAQLDHAGRRAAEHERSRADGARPAGRDEEPVAAAAELKQPRRPESQRAAAADRGRLELGTERPAGPKRSIWTDATDAPSREPISAYESPASSRRTKTSTLSGRQRVQRGDKRVRLLVWRLRRRHPVRVGLLLLRPAAGCPEACAAHVLRDREQPGARRMRPRAAEKRAVRFGEGGLRHVLGGFERSIDLVARPVDANVHQEVKRRRADGGYGGKCSLVRAMFGTPDRT